MEGRKRDRRKQHERRRDEIRQRDGATRYDLIMEGSATPEGQEKGWQNLQPEKYNFAVMDKEKHREISRKGAAAVNKIHGEKKTAKQALETILTIKIDDATMDAADLSDDLKRKLKRAAPDATLYDLIQIVAAGRAVGGNIKAAEYIRDTYGDAPVKTIELNENVTTDADREMLRTIAARLESAESVHIVEAGPGPAAGDDGAGDHSGNI